METKFTAKRTRQQLLSVIAHSHVTIFTVGPNRNVTMLEGALIWNNTYEENHDGSGWFIGKNMYTVFNRLTQQLAEGERPEFLRPIEDILDGKSKEDVKEHAIGAFSLVAEVEPLANASRRALLPDSVPPHVWQAGARRQAD